MLEKISLSPIFSECCTLKNERHVTLKLERSGEDLRGDEAKIKY